MRLRNILGGAALLALLSVETLNYTGFCYADRTLRSDADYLRAAIEQTIDHPVEGDVIYGSPEEFLRLNPGCCVFDRWRTHWGGHQLLSRLFGFYAQAYLVYRRQEDGPEPYYMTDLTLDACGQSVEGIGFELSPKGYREHIVGIAGEAWVKDIGAPRAFAGG